MSRTSSGHYLLIQLIGNASFILRLNVVLEESIIVKHSLEHASLALKSISR